MMVGNLWAIGKISSLAIQALKELSKENIRDEEIEIILKHLKNEEPHRLERDIKLAPEWIRIIMRKAFPNDEK